MKQKYRVISFIASSLGIIAIFVLFTYLYKDFIQVNNKTLNKIRDLEIIESNLDVQILKSSFFLYYDYNSIVNPLKKVKDVFKSLKDEEVREIFPQTYLKILKLEQSFFEKENLIHRYITLNSVMKNSQIYIPSLTIKYLKKKNLDPNYIRHIVKAVSTVILLKNTLDISYLKDLNTEIKHLTHYESKLKTEEEKKFNQVFIRHLSVIYSNFPQYLSYIRKLISNKETLSLLKDLKQTFLEESREKSQVFTFFSFVANGLILTFVAFSTVLLIKIDKQKLKLKILTKTLEKSLYTDELTGLPNRFEFKKDLKEVYLNPTLILFNIDNFKSINDVYGTDVGDEVLIQTAMILRENLLNYQSVKPKVYRLGADDFGVLMENHYTKAFNIATDIIDKVEKSSFYIKSKDIELFITMSAGISNTEPLIETADLALKKAKTSRERVIFFSENLETKERFEKNIKIMHIVKHALEHNNVVLYFQPIMNNLTGKVEKYEVLFRIIEENGNIITPSEVLPVIKETKYYRLLTERILKNAILVLQTNPSVKLSINLSYEDIADEYIKEKLISSQCESLYKRITFEILESESVKDFNTLKAFIQQIKECNIEFAIDDFGSGYSNFLYLSEIKPDYLKIDGSLIKDIHKREELRKIVETINNFAHKIGIKTVAEFVHSEEVFKVVKEIGIDYSQGFYIGKPSPEIKEES